MADIEAIRARHAGAGSDVDAYAPRDAREAHQDRGELICLVDRLTAEVATLRAERLTLARVALRYRDPTAPMPTREQALAAYEIADRLRQTEPAMRVEES